MKYILIIAFVFVSSFANAQKVFSTQYSNQAEIKVFVVKYENQADLKVFKVKYENQVGENNGKWFFSTYENQAKKKIYFVDYENQADLKIFFVAYENQAGWRNNEEVSQMLFEGLDLEIDHHKHRPNQVAKMLFQKVNDLYKSGKITGDQCYLINAELQSFTDICGACERIKNTPIPYSYSSFIKKFIFFFVMTLPFGFVFSLGYYVIPVVIFIFYVLASLELIAEEIEDPFGGDANDLPMTKIASNIKKHVEEIL